MNKENTPIEVFRVGHTDRLSGKIRIQGAKNAALPILAASILAEGEVILEDVPYLCDITTMIDLLKGLGIEVKKTEKYSLRINTSNIENRPIPPEITSKMRASTVALGPLLGRFKEANISMPGGCVIGKRPIDLHIKGLRAMGVDIDDNGSIQGRADRLIGNKIYLDFPSVGATQNLMMAAVLAEGETQLDNAAMEPETVDLANFLNKMGADVKGAGTSTIRINGVKKLGGAVHQIIPDRIEAGTMMAAVAGVGGEVLIENIISSHLKPISAKLMEMGAEIEENGTSLIIRRMGKKYPINIKTLPHPGFPTDMQAQMMAILSINDGESKITETVFEDRFRHVKELNRMGADIEVDGNLAIIRGVETLQGREVRATDLRAGAALVIAGLMAEGETVVKDIYHIERGYESIEKIFSSLGGNISKEKMLID